MKIKSLLAAVSMVALTAGTANALQLTNGPLANNNATQALACELDRGTAPIAGQYGFDITRGTAATPATVPQFNTGINTVTITLPGNATFTRDTTGLSIQALTAGRVVNSTGNVTAGGTIGANTVTFTVNLTNNNSTILAVPLLPVSTSADPTGALTVSVIANGAETDATPGSNADVFNSAGALTSAGIFTECVPAINALTVVSDELASDTQVALPNYTTLVEGGANALGTLGSVNYSLTAPAPFIQFVNAMGAAAPLNFDPAQDATSVTLTVQPGRSTTGIATAAVTNGFGGAPLATASPASGAFSLTLPQSAALFDGTADAVVVTAAAGTAAAPILSQTVAVANAVINLDQSSPRAAFFANVPGANGGLDSLDRQGQSFGAFDWNGAQGAAGTNSVYRITRLPAGTTTGTATFTNSSLGANGTFPFSVTSMNGEAVLTSFGAFNTSNTAYGRADVVLNFEVAAPANPAAAIDVDRLLVRNGIISAFGDGANEAVASSTNSDADDTNGSE